MKDYYWQKTLLTKYKSLQTEIVTDKSCQQSKWIQQQGAAFSKELIVTEWF